jgi:hypothetical protein
MNIGLPGQEMKEAAVFAFDSHSLAYSFSYFSRSKDDVKTLARMGKICPFSPVSETGVFAKVSYGLLKDAKSVKTNRYGDLMSYSLTYDADAGTLYVSYYNTDTVSDYPTDHEFMCEKEE